MQGEQCAYIGLGAMGIEMASHIHQNLVTTSHPPLLIYNRTRARAETLKEKHPDIQIADTIEACAKADIIFTCLLNNAAVQGVVEKLLQAGLKEGAIIVEQSTIDPDVAYELSKKAAAKGVYYIASPIIGPPLKAASAELVVIMAGNRDIRRKVVPFLVPVIGHKLIELGEDVREGTRLKLTANFFVTAFAEVLAEGMTLGEAAGVGQNKVKEVIDALYPGTLMVTYADRMNRSTYVDQVYFPLSSTKKDVNLIIDMAEKSGAHVPTTRLFLEHINKVHEERGELDISSVVVELRKKAGIEEDLRSQ